MSLNPAPNWLIDRPIAHRALHDLTQGRAENSWGAFAAAIEAGYAIECDLQVSKTGDPMVFHDPTLERLTGIKGNVRDHTPDQLAELRLHNTKDGIYTLTRHLEQVDGKVPLILELKGVEGEDAGFVEGVAEAIKGYQGQLAVMSFDHWICAQFAALMPDIPRGLTAYTFDRSAPVHAEAMRMFDLQFVSYNVKQLPNVFVQDMRNHGIPVITWTVRTTEEVDVTLQHADQMTFEGFLPDPKLTSVGND